MRILVVGAGRIGARVLKQLWKNPALTIITLDPRPRPFAIATGLIPGVDIDEPLTPLNLKEIIAAHQPDLILLTMTTEDMGLGKAPGLDILTGALRDELAAVASVPVIEVDRRGV